MYGQVKGVTVVGVHGRLVMVEANVGRGLPSLVVTGMPGATVQDARERVRPAVENAGLEWPLRRVVVNLSPADLRKEGPGLDLPVAMSVLAAIGAVPHGALRDVVFTGELSLKGHLMRTPAVLSVALAARVHGAKRVVVPITNAAEAGLVDGIEVIPASTVAEVVGILKGTRRPAPIETPLEESRDDTAPDLADVRGQQSARRALEVAAAGGHNVLMVGPPGSGKTMLARRLPSILPGLEGEEALEVTQLHSVAGLLPGGRLLKDRPFRAPHHSVSLAGLLGGGSGLPRPGEVSLAHRGVLFLDELAEFRRDALEGLRQPLEDGAVVISRLYGTVPFPARFMLVAAANPCPCGYHDVEGARCMCPPGRLATYGSKLSGPLLDRIDIQIAVPRLRPHELLAVPQGETSAAVRRRVEDCRAQQRSRFAGSGVHHNADMPGTRARAIARCTADADLLLTRAMNGFHLSGRGFDRVLRVARTIADLDGSGRVDKDHVGEALSYRMKVVQQGAVHAV